MVSVSTNLTTSKVGDFQQGVAGMQDIRILRSVRGRGLPREYVGIQQGIGGVERMCTLRAMTLPLVAGQKSEAADALMREAAISMALSHPAILPTYGWYERYGELLLVQAFEGLSTMDRVLKSVRKHAAPAADRITWHVALHLFEALAYAHTRAGVVHGDVHPACMIIHSSGQILLRGFRGDEPLELQDEKYLAYAAPEVIRGGGTSAASDLYSAALIVREMLTGVPSEPPKRRLHTPMKATSELRAGIPSAVAKGLDVCLSVEPTSRALNAAEMASLVRGLTEAGSQCERLQQVRQRVARALPMAERDLYLGRFVNEQLLDSYAPTVRFERREVLAAEVDTRSSMTSIDVFHPGHPLRVHVRGRAEEPPPIGYTDEAPDVRIYDDEDNEEDEPTLKRVETAASAAPSDGVSVADASTSIGEHASLAMTRPSEPTLPDAPAVEDFAIETEVRVPSQALEGLEQSGDAVSSFDVDTEIGMRGREAELVAEQDVVPSAKLSVKVNSFPPVAGESQGRPRSSASVRRVSAIALGVAAGFAIFGALRLTGWSWGNVGQVSRTDATNQAAAQSRLGQAPGVVREKKKMPSASPRKMTAVKVPKTSKPAHVKKPASKPNASVPGAKLPTPVPWNKSAVIVVGPPDGQVYLNGKKVGHTNRRLLVNGCGYRFLRVGRVLVRPGAASGIRWMASGHTVKLVCGKVVEARAAVMHTRKK